MHNKANYLNVSMEEELIVSQVNENEGDCDTRHYPQPVVSAWSMRRFEKLDLDIMIRGNFIADNELNSALSGSFLNSTGVHHRSSLYPRKQ